jgi:hypothetical protein
MKFIIMQFSTRFVFLPFRFKCPPQHSVLKNPSVCVPLLKSETKPCTNTVRPTKSQFRIF